MGAETFTDVTSGRNAQEAFRVARANALYMSGHGGYTGTIAEKDGYVVVSEPLELHAAYRRADELVDADDERVVDKWGPAGCIPIKDSDEFLFFGWASS